MIFVTLFKFYSIVKQRDKKRDYELYETPYSTRLFIRRAR